MSGIAKIVSLTIGNIYARMQILLPSTTAFLCNRLNGSLTRVLAFQATGTQQVVSRAGGVVWGLSGKGQP
jgi:hypothetical protein